MNKKELFFILSLVFFISIGAMEQPPKKTDIQLISSDNQKIIIPFQVAFQSPVLSDILKNFQEDQTKSIPFTIIDGETLTTVVKILSSFYKHQDLKGKSLLDAVEKDVPIYDSNAILLLRAFDFLDFMPGIRLVARYLSINSSITKDKSRGITTFSKQLLYGTPIMDHVIALIKANQFTYNTNHEIGRMYFLTINKNRSELYRAKNLPGIDADQLTFSLRDYLDYLPEIIRKRHKSNSLDLDGLKLKDLDGLQDIPDIHNVTNLMLGGNKLISLPDFSLQGFNNLESLQILINKLTAIPATSFQGLKKLKVLCISFNPFTELPVTIFQDLHNLRVLILSTNKISELPPTLFHGLDNLRHLALYDNKLSSLPETLFNGLSNLESLHLSSNQLSILPARLFNNLNNLQELDLGSNQLKNLPSVLFTKLSSLKKLNLSNNQLSDGNIQELRNGLPQVKIYLDYSHWFSDTGNLL